MSNTKNDILSDVNAEDEFKSDLYNTTITTKNLNNVMKVVETLSSTIGIILPIA